MPNPEVKFTLPPSARVLGAAEMNAVRLSDRGTVLTPAVLERARQGGGAAAAEAATQK